MQQAQVNTRKSKKQAMWEDGIQEVTKGKVYRAKLQWRQGEERLSKTVTIHGTKTEAKKQRVQLQNELNNGNLQKTKKITVNAFLDK